MTIENIIQEIVKERKRQTKKFGEQNWPVIDQEVASQEPEMVCYFYGLSPEQEMKNQVDEMTKDGSLTYMDILQEELSEAVSCGTNTENLRTELIQCAAVIVAAIESLDRNGR